MASQWLTIADGNVKLLPYRPRHTDEDQLRRACEQLRSVAQSGVVHAAQVSGEVWARGVKNNLETVVVLGNIVEQPVDVLVNAANSRFGHGGGVALAIADAALPEFERNGQAWLRSNGGECRTGGAAFVVTGLKNNQHVVGVVNAVGPDGTTSPRPPTTLIRDAMEAAFQSIPTDLHAPSLAVPLISGGIFGYLKAEAAGAIADAVLARAQAGWQGRVVLVSTDRDDVAAFRDAAITRELASLTTNPPAPTRWDVVNFSVHLDVNAATAAALEWTQQTGIQPIPLTDGTLVLPLSLRDALEALQCGKRNGTV